MESGLPRATRRKGVSGAMLGTRYTSVGGVNKGPRASAVYS